MDTPELGNHNPQEVVRQEMISKIGMFTLGSCLSPDPSGKVIPPIPALSLPRRAGHVVAAGILNKCHSFFYFPFLLIDDILNFFND